MYLDTIFSLYTSDFCNYRYLLGFRVAGLRGGGSGHTGVPGHALHCSSDF